jgi:hypothetical protein
MKCIKAIRASKGVDVGDIKRVDEKTAMNMVGNSWQYISKTEWKLSRGKKVVKEEINPNHESDKELIDEAATVSMNTAIQYQKDKEKKKKNKKNEKNS